MSFTVHIPIPVSWDPAPEVCALAMNPEVARRYQEVHETLDDGRAVSSLGFSVYSLHGPIRKQHAALGARRPSQPLALV